MTRAANHNYDDTDAPRCPSCDYSLTALPGSTCPECGGALEADREQYRPSRASTPWSLHPPQLFVRGVWQVLRHPVRTLDRCASPRQVTVRRALAFALLCSGLTALSWAIVREFGLCVAMSLGSPGSRWFEWRELFTDVLQSPLRWRHVVVWEAWAILRWWFLFALIAFLPSGAASAPPGSRSIRQERALRLLLLAPWFTVAELMFLAGVWIARGPSIVPEPSTLFAVWPISLKVVWTDPTWLTRAVVPTIIVGLVFGQAVMKWRRIPPSSLPSYSCPSFCCSR
jgi:hypothetical protein